MKRFTQLSILFLLMLMSSNLQAQIKERLSLTVNLARITPTPGIFRTYYSPLIPNYRQKAYFLNGFELGYKLTNNREVFAGIKRVNMLNSPITYFTMEDIQVNGLELHSGLKFSSDKTKKVYISFVGEFFLENARYEGFFGSDGPPFRSEINHMRIFVGLAPGLELTIRIKKNMLIAVGSRIRAGAVLFRALSQAQSDEVFFPSSAYFNYTYEPLNILGIKFGI